MDRAFLLHHLFLFSPLISSTSILAYMVLDDYREVWEAPRITAVLLFLMRYLSVASNLFWVFYYLLYHRPAAAAQRKAQQEDGLQGATIVVEAYEHGHRAPALDCAVCLDEVEKGRRSGGCRPACMRSTMSASSRGCAITPRARFAVVATPCSLIRWCSECEVTNCRTVDVRVFG